MPNHSLRNPSACYRVNKLYKDNEALKSALDDSAAVGDAAEALRAIVEDIATTAQAPAPVWPDFYFPVSQNFWMGKLRYDTSTLTDGVYVSDHRKAFASAAHTFRKQVYIVIDATRQTADMANVTDDRTVNPGGIADATPSI